MSRETTSPLVRIVVIDDHAVVRRGLVDLLGDEPGLQVCGESASIADAIAVIEARRPDVVIVDLSLGSDSGMDLVTALTRAGVGVRILVLSAHDEQLFAERALRAGAHGYIMKAESADELVRAVRQVAAGRPYVSESVAERILLIDYTAAGHAVFGTAPIAGKVWLVALAGALGTIVFEELRKAVVRRRERANPVS